MDTTMRTLIKLFIAVLLLVCAPAWARSINVVVGQPIASGPAKTTLSDAFTYSNGNLATVSGGAWSANPYMDYDLVISSNTCTGNSGSGKWSGSNHETGCLSIEQYMKISVTSFPANCEIIMGLRGGYVLEFIQAEGKVYWMGGEAGDVEIANASFTVSSSIGVTSHATGDDTVVNVWSNPTASAPSTYALWDGNGPTVSFTTNPGAAAVDSGSILFLMLFSGDHGPAVIDNFSGGDI